MAIGVYKHDVHHWTIPQVPQKCIESLAPSFLVLFLRSRIFPSFFFRKLENWTPWCLLCLCYNLKMKAEHVATLTIKALSDPKDERES